jgi:hypothetical protein
MMSDDERDDTLDPNVIDELADEVDSEDEEVTDVDEEE